MACGTRGADIRPRFAPARMGSRATKKTPADGVTGWGGCETWSRVSRGAVTDSAAIDLRQSACRIPTKRALELPTARTKPKAFGACPEKHLCARQLVLETAMTGIAL